MFISQKHKKNINWHQPQSRVSMSDVVSSPDECDKTKQIHSNSTPLWWRSIDPLSERFRQFAALPLLAFTIEEKLRQWPPTPPKMRNQNISSFPINILWAFSLWELFTIKSNQDTFLMNAFIYECGGRKSEEIFSDE